MLLLTVEKLLTHYCLTRQQWILQLSYCSVDEPKEIIKAAPFLRLHEASQLALRETIFFPFNMECAARHAYDTVVGDDGPTKLNKYDGPCKILATLWNSRGEVVNENT